MDLVHRSNRGRRGGFPLDLCWRRYHLGLALPKGEGQPPEDDGGEHEPRGDPHPQSRWRRWTRPAVAMETVRPGTGCEREGLDKPYVHSDTPENSRFRRRRRVVCCRLRLGARQGPSVVYFSGRHPVACSAPATVFGRCPGPILAVAMGSPRAPTPASTEPIPSGRDRAESLSAPLALRILTHSGLPSTPLAALNT